MLAAHRSPYGYCYTGFWACAALFPGQSVNFELFGPLQNRKYLTLHVILCNIVISIPVGLSYVFLEYSGANVLPAVIDVAVITPLDTCKI